MSDSKDLAARDLLGLIGSAALVRRQVDTWVDRLGPYATEADILRIARRAAALAAGNDEGAGLLFPTLLDELASLGILRPPTPSSRLAPLSSGVELH